MYRSFLVKYGGVRLSISPFMDSIRQKLPELRKAKGWSRDRLSHEAFAIDQEGTSGALITGIERGTRRPSARTMAALAAALQVDPREFAEYRLALARHVLDEEKVGLDQAIENLEESNLEEIEVSLEEIKRHSHQRRGAVARAQELAEETVQRVQPKRRSP